MLLNERVTVPAGRTPSHWPLRRAFLMVPALRRAASLNSPIGCELPANTSSSTCQSSSISTMRRHLGLLVLLALLAALGSAVAEEAASGLQQANRKGNFDYFFLVRWVETCGPSTMRVAAASHCRAA